ncbi:MAG: small ribosomal subunit biogenesis GTPase RsgA [Enterobacteriaceae bacterium]
MSKKRLSQGQQRRMHANHERRLQRTAQSEQSDTLFGEAQEGIVISRFGKQADIESADGVICRCNIRRTISSLVTGDRVVWRADISGNDTNGIVDAVHPRDSLLVRPDFYDGLKPVAANIDQIVIVLAPVPELSLNLLDRYLVACETLQIKPLLLLNKCDLLKPEAREQMEACLTLYSGLGYRLLFLSSHTGEGLPELLQELLERTSIFVGQSGVGKSSLLNLLLPETEHAISVGELSEGSGLGQHTTTSARLYHLPQGGEVIDSPGVREFALWHLLPEQVTQGFIEFRQWAGTCRFRDCKHGSDPGCALRAALERGEIAQSRFNSYHQILQSMAQTRPSAPLIQKK